MEHFSERAWADFTRGLRTSEPGNSISTEGIQAHLASGCLHCKATHSFLSQLHAMAQGEQAVTPPADLVRLAKLEFQARHQEKDEKWTLARLVFDSRTQPLPAGIRSSAAAASRQLVFEVGGLTIDLRIDKLPQPNMLCLVGQILDRKLPQGEIRGASVVLWTEDGSLVAAAEANQFGEFQLEFESQEGLQLTAKVDNRKVQIPLIT
jgi:hypothetical protein